MTTTVRVEGVQETIKILREIDPELRKSFNKNAKEITKPLVAAAQAAYRSTSFPSGTARPWAPGGRQIFPLTPQAASKGVTTKISTSKRNAGAIVVVQANPGGAVFEFARNGALGQAFNVKNGYPARVMWKAADQNLDAVQRNMVKYIDEVSETITKRFY